MLVSKTNEKIYRVGSGKKTTCSGLNKETILSGQGAFSIQMRAFPGPTGVKGLKNNAEI